MRVKLIKTTVREFPPADKPEVVFVGRSNVGKSSLINYVVGRNIARVSKQPGRTRTINFFILEDKIYLVDVPGYGFAKRSKEEREKWKSMMENYFLERRGNIKRVFQLIDSVAGVQPLDVQMIEWLRYLEIPFTVVMTKVDKASQKEISKTYKDLKSKFGDLKVIRSSVKEGKGKKEILSEIFSST